MIGKLDTVEYFDNQLLNHDSDIDYKIFADIQEHGRRVARLALLMGKRLEMNEKELATLNQSALLHDYGKYYIPKNILLKPGKLTNSEMSIMKKHAYYSSKIAMHNKHDETIASVILYHHENYDGTGYYGIKNTLIPISSRIIRIADVYDALTCDRPYRKALSSEAALEIMDKEQNFYDKKIYALFLKTVRESEQLHSQI